MKFSNTLNNLMTRFWEKAAKEFIESGKKKPKLLVSSSIPAFREKAEKTWGLERYNPLTDKKEPVVFFGLYHIGDYLKFLKHRGERIVFWCGDDIVNLKSKYLFSNGTQIILSKALSMFPWYKMLRLDRVRNYVENELEQDELTELGIKSEVRPSFVEDVNDFPISFKPSKNPQVFLSGWAGRQEEYGYGWVTDRLAWKCPEITFHLYGAGWKWLIRPTNVVLHGKVPQEQFNREIRNYHCGLRLNEHDGNSEIAMKSVLCGGYPITRIKYPMIDNYETEEELVALLRNLKYKREPNFRAREYWLRALNNFPWKL